MRKLLIATLLLGFSAITSWAGALPKLVDVGADKCIPCIKMAPILDQLKEDFTGRLEVKFVDAWKNSQEAESYRVRMIPTQIFYAPDGTELYRHTGFFSREEILAKWQQLGYDFADEK
ncbi:co-chaperone YbbN [Malonomonas rubra]|uniref:thioredoxin family protein n=1 Tax=Malonomonas rubra TaxID=57040 RepID=UPI0026EDAEC7|nr:thioredoxin family protein [Malonomonas rubra]